jgi:hypothetical protein
MMKIVWPAELAETLPEMEMGKPDVQNAVQVTGNQLLMKLSGIFYFKYKPLY